jgi:hypothetical protein
MIAEKFFLVLEALISHMTDSEQYPDGGPRVITRTEHVPISLHECGVGPLGHQSTKESQAIARPPAPKQ